METLNDWKLQTFPFDENLHQALIQQHHAAQFVALAGKYLIPQQPDDSNTNMEFLPAGDLLAGHKLGTGARVVLQLTDLSVGALSEDAVSKILVDLKGKTKQQVFDELKRGLSELGVDVAALKNELHYQISAHPLDEGAVFTVNDRQYFYENTILRYNANSVLNEIAAAAEKAEPVRVWPHHFDTGSLIPVSHNGKGELSQSIGIGWAISDSMIDEPYYYLSFWSEKPVEKLKELPPLETGRWMMPGWSGAVLKHSEILEAGSANEQHEMVKSFFDSGIKILLDRF